MRRVVLLTLSKLSQKCMEGLLPNIVHEITSYSVWSCLTDVNIVFNVIVVAGCIALATDGICVIPNMAVLKKDQKEKLQNGRHDYLLTVQLSKMARLCY